MSVSNDSDNDKSKIVTYSKVVNSKIVKSSKIVTDSILFSDNSKMSGTNVRVSIQVLIVDTQIPIRIKLVLMADMFYLCTYMRMLVQYSINKIKENAKYFHFYEAFYNLGKVHKQNNLIFADIGHF